MTCLKSSESVEKTVEILLSGGIAIIPTDTVYGFSGIVDLKGSPEYSTDKKIRSIKGREESKPLIQLIADPEDIKKYTTINIPEKLLELWPGPLTIIVPVKDDSPLAGDYSTVAFRCPGDLWLREIIRKCNAPLFSTSVNRSGSPVLETFSEIKSEFEKEVDILVDDGDKKGSLPSTIVLVEENGFKVLRQGAVTVA